MQPALRGEAGVKGPAASNHGQDCEFYPKDNQYAVKAVKNRSGIAICFSESTLASVGSSQRR